MIDDVNNNIAMPEVEEVQEIHEETQESPTHEQAQTAPGQNPEAAALAAKQQDNFRRMREKQEQLERERDLALQKLKEFESKTLKSQPQEEPDYAINPNDLVEGKHLSKYDKKIKQLEEQVQKYQQQSYEIAAESRVKAQYPDFDSVVSQANIEALRMAYPEVAQSLAYNQDLYSKAAATYTMIKNLGLAQDTREADAQRAIAQKNVAKPRPSNSIAAQSGSSPLSHANAFAEGLTDELKAQLIKEMVEARRGY